MDTVKMGDPQNATAAPAPEEKVDSKRVITIEIEGQTVTMKDEIDGKLELQVDWPEIPQRIRAFLEVNDNEIKTQKSK
jgi:hypothetical protein